MIFGDIVISIIFILIEVVVIIVSLMLMWRIAIALEIISRHLFEIAKDVKRLSIHFREEKEEE